MDDTSAQWLPLFEAVVAWSDQRLVEAVKNQESYFSMELLKDSRWPNLLPPSEHVVPRIFTTRPWEGHLSLHDMWIALECDFCDRVIRSEISIQGVQIAPDLETEHRSIPQFWAREFRFDLHDNAICFKERRYTAVRASRIPASGSPTLQPSRLPAEITSVIARRLSDVEVLTLLEEHARRVVEEPHAKLMPSRMSLMPIIARKMRHRAATGELHAELASEADELERWIKGKAPSHQTPGTNAIRNSIRDEYRKLKPQSKGIKA